MFDIGFSELLVIAVVALIVIGPERLPKVARTLGHLFGRMQRYVNDVKADITREMELDELRKLQSSVEDAARSIQDSVEQGSERDRERARTRWRRTRIPAPDYPELPGRRAGSRGGRRPPQQLDLALEPDARAAAPKRQTTRSRSRRETSSVASRRASVTVRRSAMSEDTFISHLIELRDRLLRSLDRDRRRVRSCSAIWPGRRRALRSARAAR